jgi:CheY-like chemotaxis protein
VFSRKQIVAPRPLDVSEVLEGMHAMLRRIIGEDVELVTHCQRPVGLVQADAGQIEQVLMNLAVNSRDAMPDGGTLTFRVQNIEVPVAAGPVEAGAYVQLSVTDTGSGISPEVLPHIFEPFFTTKEAGRGTGLGLATIYGIVTQAGGHIEVTSEKGRGTTFTVLLPCLPAQTVAARRGASSQQLARGSERILVVEDEEMVRGVVCAMLGRCGYEVLQASRAEEALDTCARHEGRIDLLLTDVVLQGANGRVLADEIKARYPDIRVVFMSGYTDDAVVRSGVLRAEVDFLQKPLTATALTRKVREVLDRGR